jgi:hypothetical protein
MGVIAGMARSYRKHRSFRHILQMAIALLKMR